MTALSLISVNIERSKHLDLVVPFVNKRKPDVVCFQELCESDVPTLESALGMKCVYAPMGPHPADPPTEGSVIVGIGICTSLPITMQNKSYYAGSRERAYTDESQPHLNNRPLLSLVIEKDDVSYRICTTHFAWTPDGKPSDEQRRDMGILVPLLESVGEFVLCGDFNAPRGGEMFAELSTRYTDNIPSHYATSIDIPMHYAGKLRPHELADKMVDGLFSTPGYQVSDAELVSGVSDHCAVVATVSRN